MNEGRKRITKQIIAVLIVLNLIFIFVHSLIPPEKSAAESDAVGEIIGSIISPETGVGAFVQKYVRKIAHFAEFMTLGVLASLFVILFEKTKKAVAYSYVFAVFVALFDETIQIFSARGSSVCDVWLDFFGFLSLSSVLYIAAFFYKRKSLKERVEK